MHSHPGECRRPQQGLRELDRELANGVLAPLLAVVDDRRVQPLRQVRAGAVGGS